MKTFAIIGGGFAGMHAAFLLAQKGHAITLFEASNALGGRAKSVVVNGFLLSVGAAFIHGELEETLRMCKLAGIAISPANLPMSVLENGKLSRPKSSIPWGEVAKYAEALLGDMPLSDFAERYFPETTHPGAAQELKRFAAGYDAADPATASTQALMQEWLAEEETQYWIEGGYQSLIAFYEAQLDALGVKILLETLITRVKWSKTGCVLSGEGTEAMPFEVCILAVPLSILQQERIAFSPALPEKTEAARQIGFGLAEKVIYVFAPALLEDAPELQSLCARDRFLMLPDAPVFDFWWVRRSTANGHECIEFTAWLGGTLAAPMASMPAEEAQAKAMTALAAALSVPEALLQNHLLASAHHPWATDPWAGGGYSFALSGHVEARTRLAKPVGEVLYFIGEATYAGSPPGTVEAALGSANFISNNLFKEEIGDEPLG